MLNSFPKYKTRDLPGLTDLLAADLELIQKEGMRAAVKQVIA